MVVGDVLQAIEYSYVYMNDISGILIIMKDMWHGFMEVGLRVR